MLIHFIQTKGVDQMESQVSPPAFNILFEDLDRLFDHLVRIEVLPSRLEL
jgi:hypothetical protein